MSRLLTAAFLAATVPFALHAQTSVPANQVSPFKDTSMLKPPAGQKIAIIEWEDLECPACARAFPIVHAAMKQYNVPLIRHDFQIPGHIWSHDAALYARYIQNTISPDLATDYRRQVFASQYRIASQDDLKQFTQSFFKTNGKQLPFVIDPTGAFQKENDADKALGDKLGLTETPTLIVATPTHRIQGKDIMQLYSAIDQAQASLKTATPAKASTTHATHTTPTKTK